MTESIKTLFPIVSITSFVFIPLLVLFAGMGN